jgi:hypothetical protein
MLSGKSFSLLYDNFLVNTFCTTRLLSSTEDCCHLQKLLLILFLARIFCLEQPLNIDNQQQSHLLSISFQNCVTNDFTSLFVVVQ